MPSPVPTHTKGRSIRIPDDEWDELQTNARLVAGLDASKVINALIADLNQRVRDAADPAAVMRDAVYEAEPTTAGA